MKKSLTILIIISVLSLGVIGVYAYLYRQIISTATQVASLSVELETQRSQAESLEHLKDLAVVAKANRDKLSKYIAPGGQTDKMIAVFEALAAETGATSSLGSLNVQNNVELPANLEELSMSFAFTGTWKQVISFEKTLETIPYKVTIKDLQLQGSRPSQNATGQTIQKNPEWTASYSFSIVKEKDKDETQ